MSGRKISKAIEALAIFLKSLPEDSYFNVYSFGNSYERIFKGSDRYDTESLNQALESI